MHFGLCLPNLAIYADARLLADLAQEAEQAGWDGFFVWDHISLGPHEVTAVDTWIALTAIAMKTSRIRIGPMVTPLPRRRPWKIAREAASLDHLSGGRVILGVGVGNDTFSLENFGEEIDIKKRAAMLDEALEILMGLWSGEPFNYNGAFYTVKDTLFLPRPIQTPRIPIWVAGTWPNKAPLRRAARWDGIFPSGGNHDTNLSVDVLCKLTAYIREHRTANAPFDVVHRGSVSTGDDPVRDRELIVPYAEAGVTWWLEPMQDAGEWGEGWSIEATLERIRKGPPRLS